MIHTHPTTSTSTSTSSITYDSSPTSTAADASERSQLPNGRVCPTDSRLVPDVARPPHATTMAYAAGWAYAAMVAYE